jgi:hypothetical protein
VGTIAITGGLRTTPTDTLDAHASILLIRLKLGRNLYRAAVRISSLPNSHPLRRQYSQAGARKPKRHRSALHYMTQLYGIKVGDVETLPVVRQNPAKANQMPVTLEISGNKEESKRQDANAKETIKVYSDSSAKGEKVGAAALLTRQGQPNWIL